MKDIEFNLEPKEIHPNSEIRGTVVVSYPGRYDGVVINTQISDSNDHIIYKSYNGKKISQNVSRLFINKTTFNTLLVGTDPVAVDRIGYEMILAKRREEKIQKEENPKARLFMDMAAGLGLGYADLKQINLLTC